MFAIAPPFSISRSRARACAQGHGYRAKKAQIPRRGRAVSGHRYYSSDQGRFLGRDPKGEIGGFNLYAFSLNNPINRWDYLGMVTMMPAFGAGYREETSQLPNGCVHHVIYAPDDMAGGDGAEYIYDEWYDCPNGVDPFDDPPSIVIDGGGGGIAGVGAFGQIADQQDDAPNKTDDCAKRRAQIEARKGIADRQYNQLFGPNTPNSYEQKPGINDVAGAAGTAVGIADTLFSGAGYKGNAIGVIGAVTFAIPYASAVKDAVDQGMHGTTASYFGALGEVVRQGAVFTGGAWVGTQMIKTPTPVTIIGGAVLIAGGVGIDAFNRYQDVKFGQEQRLADALQRQTNQQNFKTGVANLNNDIAAYNRDCAGK